MISELIWKFRVEDIEDDIYSILGNSITDKEKMCCLGEYFAPRLDYIKANLLINLYKNQKKRKKEKIMEKTETETEIVKKGTKIVEPKKQEATEPKPKTGGLSREERQKQFQERTRQLKMSILEKIGNIDIDNPNYKIRRENANFLYKVNRGINAASFSDEKEVSNIILSSEKTKDMLEYAEKIDGILSYYNKEIEVLAQKGQYNELTEHMKNAGSFVENIEKSLTSLQDNINSAFEKGIGGRRDLEDFRKVKRKENINKAAEILQTGELPSVVKDKLGVADEVVSTALNRVKTEYIRVHQDEIIEKLNKKIAYEEIAEQMEIKSDDIWEVYKSAIPDFIESNKADILKMTKDGLKSAEIADSLNIKNGVLFPYMRDIHISILTSNKAKIVKQVLEGTLSNDIAKSYNVPPKMLKKQITEWAKTDEKLQMVSADKPTEKVEEKPKVKKPAKTQEEPKAESADKPIEKVVQEPVKKEK